MVTGVSGRLGQRVAARLVARPDVERVVGIDVVAPRWSDPKLDVSLLDLALPSHPAGDDVRRALGGASAVIHLAWRTPDARGDTATEEEAAATANRRALAAVLGAASADPPASFVHLSSATVYGAWPDNKVPLTEDTPLRPNPEFAFAVGKAEAERAVADWAECNPAVAVAVLRPAVTVGVPERALYRALDATRAPRSGDGARPVQYLHVDDLAAAVVLAWERRLSGVYNVAPDAGVSEDEARLLAGGVAKVTLPARVAHAVSGWSWHLWRGGVPPQARAYATHPWAIAPDRLKAEGWSPQYSSEEALVATDVRQHWDDLPPGRRQNYNLLLAAGGLLAVGGAAAAAVVAWRSRRSPR